MDSTYLRSLNALGAERILHGLSHQQHLRPHQSLNEALARVGKSIDELVAQVVLAAQPGDHIVCMSNGGFGGVHERLLKALSA